MLAVIVAMWHTSWALLNGASNYYYRFGPVAAVNVFFVISGYSMYHSYTERPSGFLRRRLWRVTPVYWLGCVGSLLPYLIYGRDIEAWTYGFRREYHLQNVLPCLPKFLYTYPALFPSTGEFNTSLWSLGVEMAFYAAVPLLARTNDKWLFAAIIPSVILRTFTAPGFNWISYPQALGLFLLGWMLPRYAGKPWFCALLVVSLPLTSRHDNDQTGWITALLGALLIVNSAGLILAPKWQRVALYLGDLSFPLYIVHVPVAWIFAFSPLPLRLIDPEIVLLVSIAVSALILHAVDRPLRRFGRDEMAPKGSHQPVTA